MADWDKRFILLADHISNWSKDNTKVGSVITDSNNKILSTGYNGMPSWFNDEYLCEVEFYKPTMITHAEVNALNCLTKEHYNKDLTLYVTRPVCKVCASFIVYSFINITKIVYVPSNSDHFDKKYFIKESLEFLKINNIEVNSININKGTI